nr:UBP1-associated protein 2A-like [Ipomoea batatas]
MEADVSKSDANPSNDAVSTGKANGEEKKAEVEEFDDEPLEKVLEPFSKEQLQVIIQEAVTKHPDFMENIRNWADKDPAHRKIFVHGLGWDTTTETLTNVFGKYGEIEDCKAVTDKVSGKSKGYAFILFKHRSGARKALKEPQKKIGNRITSCQLASAGPVPAPPPNPPPVSEYTQRKIFVSNVSADLDPKKLLEFFSKYGEIEEGPLGLDKHTGKPKGFCLFVYRSVESAKKVLEEPHKIFEGHTLNCQKAIDGPKQNKNYSQQQQHQPHYPQPKKGKYSSGGGGGGSGATSAGHLMAPAAGPGAVGFNPAVAPVLGQALTALLTTQGAGLGIGNLLGGLPVNPHGVPPVVNNAPGYGAQSAAGGYGGHPGMQGGYQNPAMGQGGVRPQGGTPWRGH